MSEPKKFVVIERVILERVHVVRAANPRDAKDCVCIARGEYLNDGGRPGGYVERARELVIKTSQERRRREWISVMSDEPDCHYEGEDPKEPKWKQILDDPKEFG